MKENHTVKIIEIAARLKAAMDVVDDCLDQLAKASLGFLHQGQNKGKAVQLFKDLAKQVEAGEWPMESVMPDVPTDAMLERAKAAMDQLKIGDPGCVVCGTAKVLKAQWLGHPTFSWSIWWDCPIDPHHSDMAPRITKAQMKTMGFEIIDLTNLKLRG